VVRQKTQTVQQFNVKCRHRNCTCI